MSPEAQNLASLTSAAVARSGVLLIPLGATEQHGPHLPLGTDTIIAEEVARRAATAAVRAGQDVICAPTIPYGSSGEHQSFPGTLSIGTTALTEVLIELARSATGSHGIGGTFAAVVFVNGHGGNTDAVRAAVERLRSEGRQVTAWHPRLPAAGHDAHAGRTETSIMLALAPTLVGPERPVGATEPVRTLLPELRQGGIAAVSENGVLGDASDATAEHGRELVTELVADLTRMITNIVEGT